jgi:hypothetical protein
MTTEEEWITVLVNDYGYNPEQIRQILKNEKKLRKLRKEMI